MRVLLIAISMGLGAPALGQVMLAGSAPVKNDLSGRPDTLAALRDVSLLMVEPPKPRTFAIHDKVTIIISETSKQSSDQTLDTKKDYTFKGRLNRFPNLKNLLDAQFTSDSGSPITGVDVSHNGKFTGQGKLSRNDTFTDKITATVIDVKPNGVIVVEARKTIKVDEEEQTLVLSGECRREDVTQNNTVLSSQLADLTLITRHTGQVKDSGSKGLIPRIFDALFNF